MTTNNVCATRNINAPLPPVRTGLLPTAGRRGALYFAFSCAFQHTVAVYRSARFVAGNKLCRLSYLGAAAPTRSTWRTTTPCHHAALAALRVCGQRRAPLPRGAARIPEPFARAATSARAYAARTHGCARMTFRAAADLVVPVYPPASILLCRIDALARACLLSRRTATCTRRVLAWIVSAGVREGRTGRGRGRRVPERSRHIQYIYSPHYFITSCRRVFCHAHYPSTFYALARTDLLTSADRNTPPFMRMYFVRRAAGGRDLLSPGRCSSFVAFCLPTYAALPAVSGVSGIVLLACVACNSLPPVCYACLFAYLHLYLPNLLALCTSPL